MKPKIYMILSQAVEDGVKRGYRRAFKHVESPSEEAVIESIDSAVAIHSLLKQQNHSVALYHSRLSPSVRRENLKMFRLGLIDILVTCRALDEGANIPETCLAIVAAATASQRQRIQRLGRVLRPSKGKEKAIIYTLFATEVERRRLLEEQSLLEEFVSVKWQRLSDGK